MVEQSPYTGKVCRFKSCLRYHLSYGRCICQGILQSKEGIVPELVYGNDLKSFGITSLVGSSPTGATF